MQTLAWVIETVRSRVTTASLSRSALIAMVITIAGAAVSYVLQMILARSMETSDYGAYLYILSMMNVLLIAGRLEFDGSAVRWVSQYVATERWDLVRGYVAGSFRIVLVASGLVGVASAALLATSTSEIANTIGPAGFVACLLLPVTATVLLTSGILRGLKEYVASQVPFTLLRPLLLMAGVIVAALWSVESLSTATVLGLNLGAAVVTLVVLLWLLARRAPAPLRAARTQYEFRPWFSAAGAFLVMSIAQLILSEQMDLLVVGSMLSTDEAAKYGVAGQLATMISLGITAVLFVGAPRIGELFAQQDQAGLRRHLRLVSGACAAVSIPVFLGLILVGRWLLGLYGPQYVDGFPILLVLGGAQLTSAVVGAHAGTVVSMTRLERGGAVIICLCALLNLALAIWMTARYGPIGTATATLIATVVRSIALEIFLRRRLGVTVLPH